ncbi:MAG: DUF2804 domain-containing protein [Acholeplasmataceae bacterium]
MNQHKLSKGPLLNDLGNLSEAGYHTHLIKAYDKLDVKASRLRLKEWDYYYIGNDKQAIALTVADNGYMWLVSISFFDFEIPMHITKSKMKFLGKPLGLPNDSAKGDIVFETKEFTFKFLHENGKRHILVDYPDFSDQGCFTCDLYLEQTTPHSMVIATPFKKDKHFYYNQKINLLKASGKVDALNNIYDFKDAIGVLDWGRGVWTYHNIWYWSSLNAKQDNHYIGFNLGYGFGDTSKATENMFFYDDQYYKLKDIIFDIPKTGKTYHYMEPWKIYDEKKSIDLTFTPIIDRNSKSNVILIKSVQHQVFGTFSGTVKINDEKTFEIKDLLGFAERVENKW